MGKVALALELSQSKASVAVCGTDRLMRVAALGEGRDGSESALAIADSLLRDAGHAPHEIALVAVSIGPGGFTGLRIAAAAAQTIAEFTGAQAIGVPSALVAAEGTLDDAEICSALSLLAVKRRGDRIDAWLTPLQRDGVGWRVAGAGALVEVHVAGTEFVGCTTILAERTLLPELAAHCDARDIRWVEPRFDAGACLRAAQRLVTHGEGQAAAPLVPIYPRRPEAVELWERRHGLTAPGA